MTELAGVHPTLAVALERIYAALYALGAPMRPLEGVRTRERQQALFAQGRTAPGIIVTNNDGVQHPSNHQAKADGYGYAVDSVFVGTDPYLTHHPHGDALWQVYGDGCKAMGLIWGGDFARLVDKPHAELPYYAPIGLNV